MTKLSSIEENYLKYIFQLGELQNGNVKTNDLAYKLEHSAASVTDMLKKLSDKKIQQYADAFNVSVEELKTMKVHED